MEEFKDLLVSSNRPLSTDLLADEINDETIINDIEVVIEVGGAPFAVKGDISIVGGKPKAGKTSVSPYMIATSLMKRIPEGFDTLQIRTTYCEGKPIFYIDTEQPRSYTNKLRKTILKILSVDKQPKNLHILNLRKYSCDEKRERIKRLMESFSDAHLWIIDGVADLIKDPNNTVEAFALVEELMIVSDKLNTAVVLYLHENPGATEKLRGNLGSEAERKCGGAISIKKIKEKGIHCLEAKLIRGGPDLEPIFFRYSKEHGRMISLDPLESESIKKTVDKAAIKLQKLIELGKASSIIGAAKYNSMVERIATNALSVEGKSISPRTAQSRLQSMVQNGILELNGEYYGLASRHIPQP